MSNDPTPALKTLLAHRGWARRVALCLVGDADAADDLVQETWARAMRRPPDVRRNPRPWIRTVLRNLARNRHRTAERRARREAVGGARDVDRRAAQARSPDAIVAEAEQHRRVVAAVMALDEPYRTTLVLRFYEGLSLSEIATRLGVASGTVGSRLHRAIGQLRDDLDAQEGGNRARWMAALLPLAHPGRGTGAAGAAAATSTGLLAMTSAKSSYLLVGAVLLLLLGGGAFLYLQEPDSPDGEDPSANLEVGPEAPVLVGQGPESAVTAEGKAPDSGAATAPDDAGLPAVVAPFEVRGIVRDPEGRPVSGAEVFALPRQSPGIDALYLGQARFGRIRTGEDGRFRVRVGKMRGPRLVAWLDGFLPASLDAPQGRGDEEVTLQLGAPRLLRVMVANEKGVWPAQAQPSIGTNYKTTHDRTADPRLQSFYGGYRIEVEQDRTEPLDIPIGTLAPVEVDVSPPWGYVVDPPRVVAGPDVREVTLRLVPSARIRIDVVPAPGSPAFPKDARFEALVFRGTSDEVVWSTSHPQTHFDFHRAIGVGTYRLEVRSKGRASVTRALEIREAGQSLRIEVPLAPVPPLARRATVTIRTKPGADVPEATRALATSKASAYGPRWIVLGRTPGDPRWRAVQNTEGKGDEISVTDWFGALVAEDKGLASGEYDFLVAQSRTGRVGIVRGVRIFNDQENVIDVTLEPGCFVRLPDVLDPDVPRTRITFESEGVGELPPYEFSRGGQAVWGWKGMQRQLTQVPLLDTLFGPFPGSSVRVREFR